METILFSFPGNEQLAERLSEKTGFRRGRLDVHQFPDGESVVRILTDVKDRRVVMICSLDHADDKFLPLYFACRTLKELGASAVELLAPYLAYMRQDKRFNPGESVTSVAFAALLSGFADRLLTVDPHLHRHHSLPEIYSIPTCVVHSAEAIAQWIKQHVKKPLLIGPDEESRQWVKAVADAAGAPFEVLEKKRSGDRDVEISLPHVEEYRDHVPVLIDDIISTAGTMVETTKHLRELGMQRPVCIGIHAVFAGNSYEDLKAAGVEEIVTCNTIPHPSKRIDLSNKLSILL